MYNDNEKKDVICYKSIQSSRYYFLGMATICFLAVDSSLTINRKNVSNTNLFFTNERTICFFPR